MTQNERLEYLIKYLLSERRETAFIPAELSERFRIFRTLVNVRGAYPVSDEFLRVQDEFLQEYLDRRGVFSAASLSGSRLDSRLSLWKGDITLINSDAIVNAANSALLGCFAPNHDCIDNCIHTFAGVQLRLACDELMKKQGHKEATGTAKITPAFNLPSKYILHTVGPIIQGKVKERDTQLLASCYSSCLKLADEYGLQNITFCCISTGVFHFPNLAAAQTAVDTVRKTLDGCHNIRQVIFNVFKDTDLDIYTKLLK